MGTGVPDHERHRDEHSNNVALTWEGEKTRSTIRVVVVDDDDKPKKGKKQIVGIATRDITPRDDGQYIPILKLDCDGLEPYAFHPMGKEFTAVKNDGAKVESVDLSEGEWSDYDLATGTSLIKNFGTKFE